MLIECFFNSFHKSQHPLFLQTLPNDLNPDRKTMHCSRVVVFISALRDAVEPMEIKAIRELIYSFVDVGDGNDAAGVVERLGSQFRGLGMVFEIKAGALPN